MGNPNKSATAVIIIRLIGNLLIPNREDANVKKYLFEIELILFLNIFKKVFLFLKNL